MLRPGGPIRPRRGVRGAGFHRRPAGVQTNFPWADRVGGGVMLTSAIVFGMVGVAAGFTWDYITSRDS
jgi:hypothetical protein